MSGAASPRAQPTVTSVVDRLLGLLAPDVLHDLAFEDPVTAVEVHFPPVRVRALPDLCQFGDECSTDGFYEARLNPSRPSICFDASVSPARAHFTILHELGHHLFGTVGAVLLDDLDRIGGSPAGAGLVEEKACHEFAGRVLIPDSDIADVLDPTAPLLPSQLVTLHERSRASWDAVAVRCVNHAPARVAVVLVRDPGFVASSVASPRLGRAWWPRGSALLPGGPLSRALQRDHTAAKDTYRYGLGYAEQLYCDTLRVNDQLAIAVMCDHPSDGRFDILEPSEPSWREREEFCAWDGEERNVGWCDQCKGQRCHQCFRCGCERPLQTPLCPGCGRPEPPNPGSAICRTCVLDGREWPPRQT